MNPEFNEIMPPRKLRHSPVRESRIPAPPQNFSAASRIRPPRGYSATSNVQQAAEQPVGGRLRPPTQIRRLQPPSSIRPPSGSQLRPPGEAPLRVIPLPGTPEILAPILKPLKLVEPSQIKSRIPASRAVRVASTSLLPKPAFLQPPPSSRRSPTSPARLEPPRSAPSTPDSVPRPRTAPATPSSVRVIAGTPARKVPVTPARSAVKKRLISDDPTSELHHVGGRDVEFVDYVPSPEAQPVQKSVRRPAARQQGRARIAKGLVRPGFATGQDPERPVAVARQPVASQPPQVLLRPLVREPRPKKVHEFQDEPSVAAAKEFASHISADLQRFQDMGADMLQLKARKAAVLSRIGMMRAREGQEAAGLDMEGFRERYGVTQSPKMRQLLELTGEWNRVILEKRELAEQMAQAQPFAARIKPKRVPTLEDLAEVPDGSPLSTRQSELRMARNERIDNYKQRKEIEVEYRRMLEERKRNIASRRPYSKEEREEIRRRYQEAQQWSYTTPTEEKLDRAIKLAETMELEQAGVSPTASPEKAVDTLFPGVIHSADITGVSGSIPIPREIPVEEINNMNNLDRTTAEVALKASLVSAPADGVAKKVLETCLGEVSKTTVEPVPQQLDPMYEIDLQLGRPKRENLVRLQGSSLPAWFPGFYTMFPGFPELIQAVKSPSSTLQSAWRKIQPPVASSI